MEWRNSIRSSHLSILLMMLVVMTGFGCPGFALKVAFAEEIPAFMDIIAGSPNPMQQSSAFDQGKLTLDSGASAPADTAVDGILTLNSAMFKVYDSAQVQYLKNLRQQYPVIVALFSGAGGAMTLYPPGRAPITGPPVPIIYQLSKAVSHSSMAIFELVGPYLRHPAVDLAWRDPMRRYRIKLQSALEQIGKLPGDRISPQDRNLLAGLLRRNIAFLDHCLAQGTFAYADLENFAQASRPDLLKAADIAGAAQVDHWMMVLKAWRKMLGRNWDRTYAVVSSLYVTRRNNILFTLVAQQMGRRAIGDRLMLFETTDFRITPDQMLGQLGRVVADRSLGTVFFGSYYFLGTEFMTGATRKEMLAQAAKTGAVVMMPPLAPYRTHQWPWPTGTTYGEGPSAIKSSHH
jgi:hypothetical protein